ncbi:sensor histidine kinase [Pseudodesulfovibrio sp.]|uniref:sensor histidine kinase n=1 Tax=unclassified Pseudodesulfovibrio TaxID=2661612 RepID=UPI003AFFD454
MLAFKVSFSRHCECESCSNENITPLYRIALEALTSAAKYATAQHIDVVLDCCGGWDIVTLTVRDDGVGRHHTNTEEGGLGISIMHHRAKVIGAKLEIWTGLTGG